MRGRDVKKLRQMKACELRVPLRSSEALSERMSVAKPRNRLVYFRVSEDEFQKLTRMCDGTDGPRSISELARAAVNRMLTDHYGGSSCSVKGRLDELQEQIGRLTDLLMANQSIRTDAAAAAAEKAIENKA